ncbi:B- and T-lymphocyte attenuator isoform X1 [Rhineura floridana]|uniref:B- and T-lymphocyte attenuator isoform X1 n=1 Tax=Rhineura floridana TaxID=261503 RepID=UPI002AC884ED|nr:B- and T-lymphocyte attenuator isoform X1 [Rhineura floridana]
MCTGSLALHCLFLMLMLENPWAYGNNNCNIAVQRGSVHKINAGNSAAIACPVEYCNKTPEINWSRFSEVNQTFLILHPGQRHMISWANGNNFVLNFSSVYKNDSGRYRCEGTAGGKLLEGHVIEVFVQDSEDANTTADHGAPEKSKMIIYLLISVGPLCLLILSCLGLLYFIRRYQVKKKDSSTSQTEMNVLGSNTDAHCSDAAPCLLQLPDGNVAYSNRGNCWKATRAASNPTCDECVSNTHQIFPPEKDTLIYATLSHGAPFQRDECSVEYANIVLKN